MSSRCPKEWRSKQIILNFEASDWETSVWVDDNFVMNHHGGYDPFTCNISPFLSDSRNHSLVVRVTDPTDKGRQPRGKQVSDPGGIWYTPSSGIWQSVWLEPAGISWVSDLRIIPDIDNGRLSVTVLEERCHGPEGCPPMDMAPSLAEVTVSLDGVTIGTASGEAGRPLTIDIPDPELWNPDNPVLYDLKIRLITGGIVTDDGQLLCRYEEGIAWCH